MSLITQQDILDSKYAPLRPLAGLCATLKYPLTWNSLLI
jgi:hypothetical protein